MAGPATLPSLPAGYSCKTVSFDALTGFAEDDAKASWSVLRQSCAAVVQKSGVLREAVVPAPDLFSLCAQILWQPEPASQAAAAGLWKAHFQPCRLSKADGGRAGFLTGYYEPVVAGSRERTDAFSEPVYGLPSDLVPVAFAERGEGFAAGRRTTTGELEPYPDRAAIDAGALAGLAEPVCWLRDGIEVFMIQVQGSCRVRLVDGTELRLGYAGRNGRPYTSIGRILITEGHMAERDMSLANLKDWVRRAGQGAGEPGRRLMQRNQSYVFFRADPAHDNSGPIGGQGQPLTTLRSIAVDRSVWPYGLPFWIDADLPWTGSGVTPFRRLMIAQDTGSAIVGPGRIDLFFGSGDEAGRRAGDIRHPADIMVLLPKDVAPAGAP